jgi:hypothetical protein
MDNLLLKGPIQDDHLEIIDRAGILVNDEIIEAIGPFRSRQTSAVDLLRKCDHAARLMSIPICWAGIRAGDFAMRRWA